VNTELRGNSKRCKIDLEGWNPQNAAWVWSDPRPEALRHGFIELAELLAQLVDDPAGVTLIIPTDLAEAIRRRETDAAYTLERGSGLVSGRTMPALDGGTDVIINAEPLLAYDHQNLPILNRQHFPLVRHTLIHEAQHAVMRQRGSGFDEYALGAGDVGTIRQFAHNAALLCDEHRAEWQAVQRGKPKAPKLSDVTAVLESLGRQLATANNTYQADPGRADAVGKLAHAVFSACNHFWRSLGYWAAWQRTDDANIADMPAEITALPLWQRYAGNVWDLLQESLRALPVEDLTTSPEILSAAGLLVAGTLRSSLETIGFRYEDSAEGGTGFYISRWDFPA
jgi:hypothetical protein